MARTVVVICDVHKERGERVECEELPPITMEGKGPRVLALCPECKWEYYDPFKELLDDLTVELSDDQDSPPVSDDLPPARDEDVKASSQSGAGGKQSKGQDEDDSADQGSSGEQSSEEDESSEQDESDDDESSADDPEQIVEASPAMEVVKGEPETARWKCPVDDCDKSYTASGEKRAEDLKRLGNLHLSTAHHLDKSARQDLLSA